MKIDFGLVVPFVISVFIQDLGETELERSLLSLVPFLFYLIIRRGI